MATNKDLPTDKKSKAPVEEKPIQAKELESRTKELKSILTKLGIKDVADRLTIENGAFKLSSTREQHADDSTVLFDMTKITPLVEKGYVVVDAEQDGEGFSVIILASDLLPEDGPSLKDLEELTEAEPED